MLAIASVTIDPTKVGVQFKQGATFLKDMEVVKLELVLSLFLAGSCNNQSTHRTHFLSLPGIDQLLRRKLRAIGEKSGFE